MNGNILNRVPVVAYFTDASYTGGAEKYLYYLAKYLSRDEFRPHVIFGQGSSPERFRSWLSSEGIPFTKLSQAKCTSAGEYFSIISLFRELKPDILHINLPGSFDASYSLVAPLAKMAGVKHIVSTEHLPMFPAFPKSRVLKGFSTRWIERVITVSKDNREHLTRNHRIPERKIQVVYNGIPDPKETVEDRGAPRDKVNKDRFNLVIAGSLEERKGQMDAVRAMMELPDSVDLYIVGEGGLKDKLKELTLDLKLEDRIHITGYKEDLPSFLRSMDLMILPSRVDATPYVIIEAMAVGLPVVASGIYGIPELIDNQKNGILIEPGDIHGLAEAVGLLLSDRELYREMSVKARESFKRRFTIEECVKNTTHVYNELMCGRKGRLD